MFFTQLCLWIVPHLLLAVCLVKMLRLRLQKQFPILISYVVLEEMQFAASLFVYFLVFRSIASVSSYRWLLVSETVISAFLQLASLYEISAVLVMRYSPLARVLWPLLRWAAALLTIIAATVAGLISQPGIQRAVNAFEVLNFSVNVVNIGTLIVLLAFTKALHLPWKSLAAGLVLGFGVNSTVEMTATALMSAIGSRGYLAMDLVRMTGFDVCVLIWTIYIFRPERSPQVVGQGLPKVDLEFWNEQLQRLVK